MIRLLYFTELKRGKERGVFRVGMEERGGGGLYGSSGESMNGRSFNKV